MRNAVAIYLGMYFSQRGCGAKLRPTTTIQAAHHSQAFWRVAAVQTWHDHIVHLQTHQSVALTRGSRERDAQCDFLLIVERLRVAQLAVEWLRDLLSSTILGWLTE